MFSVLEDFLNSLFNLKGIHEFRLFFSLYKFWYFVSFTDISPFHLICQICGHGGAHSISWSYFYDHNTCFYNILPAQCILTIHIIPAFRTVFYLPSLGNAVVSMEGWQNQSPQKWLFWAKGSWKQKIQEGHSSPPFLPGNGR